MNFELTSNQAKLKTTPPAGQWSITLGMGGYSRFPIGRSLFAALVWTQIDPFAIKEVDFSAVPSMASPLSRIHRSRLPAVILS